MWKHVLQFATQHHLERVGRWGWKHFREEKTEFPTRQTSPIKMHQTLFRQSTKNVPITFSTIHLKHAVVQTLIVSVTNFNYKIWIEEESTTPMSKTVHAVVKYRSVSGLGIWRTVRRVSGTFRAWNNLRQELYFSLIVFSFRFEILRSVHEM